MLDQFCRSDFADYADFYRNFEVTCPARFNFAYDVLDEMAAHTPDDLALLWCNDLGEERCVTFAEIKTMSDKYAQTLADLGIRKGDAVMVMLKRRYEYWFLVMAAHKIGAILIPATHMLTAKDVVYRVQSANVKMILAAPDDKLCANIAHAKEQCGDILQVTAVLSGARAGFADFTALVAAQTKDWQRPAGNDYPCADDLMLAYFTSGTTGMPKIVAHDYQYPLGHITTAKFWHGLQPGDLHLTVADTGWAKAVWGKLYGQWLCGATVFVYDYETRFQPTDFLELIDKYGITSFCAPPTIYRFFIKADLSKYSLKSLKKCTIAGEPLNPEVYQQWLQATGLKLKEGFGQTEGPIMAATTIYDEPRLGSMGKSLPGIFCDVYNERDHLCEAGEIGELCIPMPGGRRPLGLFAGYYNDETRYQSVVYNGLYHTGDIAWRDEDGYIWFSGRNDDIIKSSGYRIGPFEVESALLEHPAVMESAVTGVPDPVRGFSVKATIILAKDYAPSEELKKELQDHVKRTTAPYKYPRIIEFVDELPKTISGKIRRVEIRQDDAAK
ncbi:MAG: AMP-binding protein [Oscillospiraceae bacterium]|jgi:acetyl-CoA synthetase|nr:AMP-binding protein [Oscillospiraceae bacterium]